MSRTTVGKFSPGGLAENFFGSSDFFVNYIKKIYLILVLMLRHNVGVVPVVFAKTP